MASTDTASIGPERCDRLLLDGGASVGNWELDLATGKVRLSSALCHLFALRQAERPTIEDVVRHIHFADRASGFRAVRAALLSYDAVEIDLRLRLPAGDLRWIRARGRVGLDRCGRPERLFGTVHDVTNLKAAEANLVEQVQRDPTNGRPHRVLLVDRLTLVLQRLAATPSTLGLIHLGIDRLRVINDSLGHGVGDQVMDAVAARLSSGVRGVDAVARLSGDEFVVLCEDLASPVEIVGIADQLRAALHEPMTFDRRVLVVSVSAGVAVTSAPLEAEVILGRAEASLYGAKTAGGDRSGTLSATPRRRPGSHVWSMRASV